MAHDWGKIPALDQLKFTDTSVFPQAGAIVLCLMCGKPMLMRRYSGFPDQVCPECFVTYRDCASLICRKCNVVVAKVHPKVLDNGFYVRPRSILHIDHCNICRRPPIDEKAAEFDMSYVIEIRDYLETVGGGVKKIIIPMGG